MYLDNFLEEVVEASRTRTGIYKGLYSDTKGFKDAVQGDYSTRGYALIIEYKRCSPSKGFIAYRTPRDYISATLEYASAYSVLTEPGWFCGSIELIPLFTGFKPVLMKDFIVDEAQIKAGRAAGASAVLLIAKIIGDKLEELCRAAEKLGVDVLVEVDSARGVEEIYTLCPRIILGVNSRDLSTLKLDFDKMLDEIRRVRRLLGDTLIVAESGVTSADRAARAIEAGANALLMGTSVMNNPGILARIASRLDSMR